MATDISLFLYQSQNTHRRSSQPSPPPTTDLRHVQHRPNLTMPLLTDLTIRRIAASQHQFRFNHIRVNPVNNNLVSIELMAEESKKKEAEPEKVDLPTTTTNLSEEVKDKETEKSKTTIVPTPPEKPLPGDCCGNGCVPCVWDIYYEELEEYNRICKDNS